MIFIILTIIMMALNGIKLQCLRMHNNLVIIIILTFSTCATYSTYDQVLTSIGSKRSDLIEGEFIVTLVKLV